MTIRELSKLEGRVYVYLATAELGARFMRQAEAEGFTFADGAKPTEREVASVMAVNPDGTINYVGAVGMMAFGAAEKVGGKPLLRFEYGPVNVNEYLSQALANI